MTKKRRLLGALSKDDLLQIGKGFELGLKQSMTIDELCEEIARSKKAKAPKFLPTLGRDSLKAICRELDLPDDGKEKQVIVDRILADLNGEPNGSSQPAAEPSTLCAADVGVEYETKPWAPITVTDSGAADYRHPTAESWSRPDIGTQAQFRKKKPPATFRYDSSLSPSLEWDGQNSAREQGEALIRNVLEAKTLEEAKGAASKLKAMSRSFLNWAGKAERLSFDVPTLPLFVHERLSTKAVIETLTGHKRDKQMSFFADPQHPIADQVLKAYEHRDKWTNRMILGDSLVVMNSLLQYEGLGGQVQMIYLDPPYGVRFGSNFQPFVRRRDVAHNDDDDMTREPETVQAYRDTWELGLHSYLSYMRDRLLVARSLLSPAGSVFVQISDENLHHVRELLDEVFGPESFVQQINVAKTSELSSSDSMAVACDYILWYCKDRVSLKYRQLFLRKEPYGDEASVYGWIQANDSTRRPLTSSEKDGTVPLPNGKRYKLADLTKPGPGSRYDVDFEGKRYSSGNRWWGTPPEGMRRLARGNRLQVSGQTLRFIAYWEDFPYQRLNNLWEDTGTGSFLEDKLYVVQTRAKIVERCILMTTDPGELVLDPTCGSGTTAFVAEQWGRRWITIDTSRVPLALARQRLVTATFPYYDLKDEGRGPVAGFVYKRRQNSKGEEAGGIVPHITPGTIANDESPEEEVLVDRPELVKPITRVTGPFTVEATIPTPVDWEGDGVEDSGSRAAEDHASFVDRMLEVLRQSPVLRLEGNRTVTLKSVRAPAKTLSLSAEATIDDKPVALVFGPEDGAVSEKLVYEAAKEAAAKSYSHLYVVGFAIQPHARELVTNSDKAIGVSATYVQATPDLMMGDLLKNMRTSQIFSVCGLPEVKVTKKKTQYQVELVGVDVFDPVSMEATSRKGDDVPAWFLDTDYNGLCFHVCQAFFPRTSAWDNLKRALKGSHDDSVWDHLAGAVSAPFDAGDHKTVAVKVIDDRGNELMVVKDLRKEIK